MRPRIRLLASVAAVLALGTALVVTRADTAFAAGSKNQSSSDLSLLAPPNVATPSQPFLARLAIGAGLDRASLDLQVTLYDRLKTRTALEETFTSTPSGGILSRSETPIDVASLPPDGPHGVDLSIPVDAEGVTSPGTGPFTADLACTPTCFGVYPLRIALSLAGSSTTFAQVLTYLVYTDPSADTQQLRFALVVPLGTSPTPPTATGTLPLPRTSALAQLQALIATLSIGRIPLTLLPDPETLSSLASDTAPGSVTALRSKQVLSSLALLAASPTRQTICAPYADVDAEQLVGAGLGTELSAQVETGETVVQDTLHMSCRAGGAWIAQSPLGQQTISALSGLGFDELVLPQNAVSGSPPSTTWTQLVDVGDTRAASLPSKTMDAGITNRLQPSARTNPALAADQVIAELELAYYERPGTAEPRGVVATAPSVWGSNTQFVADLLNGLQNNLMIRPVTLGDIFTEVPLGDSSSDLSSQPSLRRPVGDSSAASIAAGAIRVQRQRTTGFASAVATQSLLGASHAQILNELLLASESSALDTREQTAALSAASASLNDQLHSLSVNVGEIRLTSNAAPVPITVVKRLQYPVTAVVAVTSDKLAFPENSQVPGGSCRDTRVTSSAGKSSFSSTCAIDHPTNVVYVDMRSRASGDFRISVNLMSPSGSLVMTSGQITVRSMSTSAVAIALSVLAGVVLLAWWGRTLMRRRSTRRPAHLRGSRTQA